MKDIDNVVKEIKSNEQAIISNINSKEIHTYELLVELLKTKNVATNGGFHELYHKFYFDNRRVTDEFKQEYFTIMEEIKYSKNINITEILKRLYKCKSTRGINTVQLSYVSKLVNLIDNSFPLYDKYVKNALNLPNFSHGSLDNRLRLCTNIINMIDTTYNYILDNKLLDDTLKLFDKKFPNNKLSKIKKLDFLIWSAGKIS